MQTIKMASPKRAETMHTTTHFSQQNSNLIK